MIHESKPDRIELFLYYVEQARHTENLWVQISKYFTTIITAVVAAMAYTIKFASSSEYLGILVALISAFGLVLSVFAFGIIVSYQHLITEWAEKTHSGT